MLWPAATYLQGVPRTCSYFVLLSYVHRFCSSHRRVLTLFDLEPEGTERGCSWPFVPFLGKKSCLGPSRILGLASQITTNDNILRMHAAAKQQRVVRKMSLPPSTVMSISIKQYFILCPFGRAVRSSSRRRRGRVGVGDRSENDRRSVFFKGRP